MALKITFRDYRFDEHGTPWWNVRTEYEQQGDGLPRILRSTYSIKQTFTEQSYADNQARRHLLSLALVAGEGVLLIEDENGTALVNEVVKVRSDSLPEQWGQNFSEITLAFEGRKLIALTETDASLHPQGEDPFPLANIQEWRQETETQRYNDERSHRKQIKVNYALSGFYLADKNLPLPARRAALEAILAKLQKSDAKDCLLTYAGQERTVRVERLSGDLGDGSERLNWSLSCFEKIYPSGDEYAEADYTLSSRDDLVAGERVINVRGNIRAATQEIGSAKADEIRQQYALINRSMVRSDIGHARLSGNDGETWVDMTFDYEFRQPIPQIASYELRISTREDVKSADTILTYQGKVTGSSAADALAKARELGAGKYPLMTQSDETVSTRKFSSDAIQLIEVTFSYEYATKSGWRYAEMTRELATDPFGDTRETISGFTAAALEEDARALAATFQLGGRLLREKRESAGIRSGQGPGTTAATSQATRFDFSYSYYVLLTSVSISYGKEESTDYSASEATTVFSGTARGPNEFSCNAAIDDLVAGAHGKRISKSRTANREQQEAGNFLVSVAFSERFVGTPVDGPDILQAEVSVRTTFSIQKAVITPIPYGDPFVQPNVGRTPGQRTVTGSVTARSAASARAWGRSKRYLMGGGYEDPAEEDDSSVYVPLDALSVKQYRFNFTYSARFPVLAFV